MFKGLQSKPAVLAAALQSMYLTKIRPRLTDERGDTNFISILIILGIVILLAGVFIGFKDQIITQVQNIISGFTIR